MRKHLTYLLLLITILLPSTILAQLSVPAQERDLELIRRESAISERLQNQLEQVLNSYYKKDSFLVGIKAYLERIPVKDTSAPQTNKQDEIELPGLPISPSSVNNDTDNFAMDKWTFSDKFKIKYLEISVLLDEKTFSNSDINFVRTVTETRIGLDENRGDMVSVKAIPFPPPSNAFEVYKDKEKDKAQQQEQQTKLISKELSPYLYIGGIFIAILLFIIIALLGLSIIKSRSHHDKYPYGYLPSNMNGNGSMQQMQNMQQSSPKQAIEQTSNTNQQVTNDDSKDIFYELRQLMVTTLVGNPKLASDVFKKWAETEQDNGIYQITGFLKATDPSLIDILQEHLGSEVSSKVKFAMNQMASVDKESIIETLKRFREEFQKEQSVQSQKASGQEDMFEFLKNMSAEQIYHVVKDEPVGIMAIALAQVSPEKANAVFKELPIEHQSKIPVEIGKLKKIPATSYKDIADKLSKKAIEVERIRYVSTDGVDALGNILEQCPPEKEQEMLASIALHDIKLAEELRKVYITFDEISKIADKTLSEILRSFEREVITRALIDTTEELKEKFLNNLPQRMKLMITDEVKAFEESGEVPIDEVQKARRVITQKIREMAKSGLVDLKKI
jgi:flagellar motor switch protein FliG